MKSFLLSKDVKMIIIACNTITFSVPASFYKGKIPVAGMSLPVPENKNIKRLAVFATAATIQSHRHKRRLLEKLPDIDIIEIPVEGLANAIEYRESEEVYRKIIEDSVMKYSAADADTAVLACTHYPLIKDTFEKVLQKVKFIDPAESTVENAMQILEEKNALADTAGRDLFFFTKDEEKSSPLVKKMFGKDSIIEKVVLSGV